MPDLVITEAISMCNELDLLEAHLEESQHWVDRMVIIESPVTFTSIEKPLYFAENRERFARFNIDHIVTPPEVFETIPEHYSDSEARHWFQARRNNRNLNRTHNWSELCRDTDYVFTTDVDEFVSSDHGPYMRELLGDKHLHYLSLKTRTFNFFVNSRGSRQSQWRAARSDCDRFLPRKGTPRGPTKECGWHFTSCMFPEEIYKKYLGIYHHLGWRREDIPSVETIAQRLQDGIEPCTETDLFGSVQEIMPRDDLGWAPKFIVENPDLFPWTDHKHESLSPGWRLK
jgi:hypothetical protein